MTSTPAHGETLQRTSNSTTKNSVQCAGYADNQSTTKHQATTQTALSLTTSYHAMTIPSSPWSGIIFGLLTAPATAQGEKRTHKPQSARRRNPGEKQDCSGGYGLENH